MNFYKILHLKDIKNKIKNIFIIYIYDINYKTYYKNTWLLIGKR